jgi:hypothetical protein
MRIWIEKNRLYGLRKVAFTDYFDADLCFSLLSSRSASADRTLRKTVWTIAADAASGPHFCFWSEPTAQHIYDLIE